MEGRQRKCDHQSSVFRKTDHHRTCKVKEALISKKKDVADGSRNDNRIFESSTAARPGAVTSKFYWNNLCY